MGNHVRTNIVVLSASVIAAILAAALFFVTQGFAAESRTLEAGDIAAQSTVQTTASKVPLSSCSISLVGSLSYTGSCLYPEPSVQYRGKQLVRGTDYDVYYADNRGVGTATVTITGKGGYTGSVNRFFSIQYSNNAIAFAACRLSYSRAHTKGHSVNTDNGYMGTPLYRKYASLQTYSCSKIVRTTLAKYLRVDRKFPGNAGIEEDRLQHSPLWKKVCRYHDGMEFKPNTILRPGDIYNSGHHTCIYVGREIAQVVYNDYLKKTPEQKKKLGKRNPDLGKPSKRAVWVSSHLEYMNGSAAHICSSDDSLVSSSGFIYRYVGSGKKVRKSATC